MKEGLKRVPFQKITIGPIYLSHVTNRHCKLVLLVVTQLVFHQMIFSLIRHFIFLVFQNEIGHQSNMDTGKTSKRLKNNQ